MRLKRIEIEEINGEIRCREMPEIMEKIWKTLKPPTLSCQDAFFFFTERGWELYGQPMLIILQRRQKRDRNLVIRVIDICRDYIEVVYEDEFQVAGRSNIIKFNPSHKHLI